MSPLISILKQLQILFAINAINVWSLIHIFRLHLCDKNHPLCLPIPINKNKTFYAE